MESAGRVRAYWNVFGLNWHVVRYVDSQDSQDTPPLLALLNCRLLASQPPSGLGAGEGGRAGSKSGATGGPLSPFFS